VKLFVLCLRILVPRPRLRVKVKEQHSLSLIWLTTKKVGCNELYPVVCWYGKVPHFINQINAFSKALLTKLTTSTEKFLAIYGTRTVFIIAHHWSLF